MTYTLQLPARGWNGTAGMGLLEWDYWNGTAGMVPLKTGNSGTGHVGCIPYTILFPVANKVVMIMAPPTKLWLPGNELRYLDHPLENVLQQYRNILEIRVAIKMHPRATMDPPELPWTPQSHHGPSRATMDPPEPPWAPQSHHRPPEPPWTPRAMDPQSHVLWTPQSKCHKCSGNCTAIRLLYLLRVKGHPSISLIH